MPLRGFCRRMGKEIPGEQLQAAQGAHRGRETGTRCRRGAAGTREPGRHRQRAFLLTGTRRAAAGDPEPGQAAQLVPGKMQRGNFAFIAAEKVNRG